MLRSPFHKARAPPGLGCDHNMPHRGLPAPPPDGLEQLLRVRLPAEAEVQHPPLGVFHDTSHSEICNRGLKDQAIESKKIPTVHTHVDVAFATSKGLIHLPTTAMDNVKKIISPRQRGRLMVSR